MAKIPAVRIGGGTLKKSLETPAGSRPGARGHLCRRAGLLGQGLPGWVQVLPNRQVHCRAKPKPDPSEALPDLLSGESFSREVLK